MRVARRDERLAAVRAPQLKAVDEPSFGPGDVLVLCAGFEDRALETMKRAAETGSRGFRVICVDYLPSNPDNRTAELRQLCVQAEASCEVCVFNREDPAGAGEEILRRAGLGQLHIDVSGMSRLLIVQLIARATREGLLSRMTLWYCEAQEYPPDRAEVETRLAESVHALDVVMFLSTGVFGLTVVPELSSVDMQGQPMVLVVFPSWNPMQLAALRAELQASLFVVVNGVPPHEDNAWRPGAVSRLNRSKTISPQQELLVSTLDYRETLHALLSVYRAHRREKLVVAPTGSKMQSVAVGILCGWLGDVQVVYPTPRMFSSPAEYTRGARTLYCLPLAAFESAASS